MDDGSQVQQSIVRAGQSATRSRQAQQSQDNFKLLSLSIGLLASGCCLPRLTWRGSRFGGRGGLCHRLEGLGFQRDGSQGLQQPKPCHGLGGQPRESLGQHRVHRRVCEGAQRHDRGQRGDAEGSRQVVHCLRSSHTEDGRRRRSHAAAANPGLAVHSQGQR